MKTPLLMLALLVAEVATAVLVDPMKAHGQQPARADKEKLKGEWILVSNKSIGTIAVIFGQVPEPDRLRSLIFSDDGVALKIDDESTPLGPYRADPTGTPKTLDIPIPLADGRETAIRGIYEIDGDYLRLCFDHGGWVRPARFPARAKGPDEKGVGRVAVLVFRKIGADPKRDALDRNRAKCAQNLATLARIMHDYVADKRVYPTAAIYGKDGKPLLSWRVALLARMDQEELLKEFKLDEPWDSEHNRKLIAKMPKIYALPGVETEQPGMTFFQVFTGKGTVFEGKEGLRLNDHLGGDGHSFMIVEAAEPVIWTKPDDLEYDPGKPLPKLGRLTNEGFHAAMTFLGEGVVFIPRSTPEKGLRSMIQWRKAEGKEQQKEKGP